MQEEKSVFISYRRDDAADVAFGIEQFLQSKGFSVFRDTSHTFSGPFDKKLLSEIELRRHFVLICSKHVFDRCARDGDWVRREIRHALEKKRHVVPVLVNGFKWEDVEYLPDDIKKVQLAQSHTHSVADIKYTGQRLVDMLLLPSPCDERPAEDTTRRAKKSAIAAQTPVAGKLLGDIIAAVDRRDLAAFIAVCDARVLHAHAATFRNHLPRIVEWSKRSLRAAAAPQRVPVGGELTTVWDIRKSNGRCTLSWLWPAERFSDSCRVVVSREKPAEAGDPPSEALGDFFVSRKSYQDAGGCRPLPIDADWRGAYISVWTRIDLGSDTLWSQPLVLGPIE